MPIRARHFQSTPELQFSPLPDRAASSAPINRQQIDVGDFLKFEQFSNGLGERDLLHEIYEANELKGTGLTYSSPRNLRDAAVQRAHTAAIGVENNYAGFDPNSLGGRTSVRRTGPMEITHTYARGTVVQTFTGGANHAFTLR